MDRHVAEPHDAQPLEGAPPQEGAEPGSLPGIGDPTVDHLTDLLRRTLGRPNPPSAMRDALARELLAACGTYLRRKGIHGAAFDDLRQDLVIHVLARLETARDVRVPRAWLLEVVGNRVLDAQRKRRKWMARAPDEETRAALVKTPPACPRATDAIELATGRHRLGASLEDLLRQAGKQRYQVEVWLSMKVRGMSAAEVVAARVGEGLTDANVQLVQRWCNRGKAVLAKLADALHGTRDGALARALLAFEGA